MANKSYIFIILIILIIAGYFLYDRIFDVGDSSEGFVNRDFTNEGLDDEGNTVVISESGFSPANLDVRKGEVVIFINRDIRNHWPATDVHPSHQVYPGSSIAKCNSQERSRIFDACRGLARGEEYMFTFNEAGNWRYHDHLNPNLRGEIVVR